MSQTETSPTAAGEPGGDVSTVESNLGQVLVLIHRVLPWLDRKDRAAAVQAALRQAAACLERAALAHSQDRPRLHTRAASDTQTAVDSETVAIIAASIAAVLDGPYRLVSVKPAAAPVSQHNAWALEGRTQIFQSHKIR